MPFSFAQTKDFLIHLILKDLKTRYKTAVLGFLWTFLQPLIFGVILSLVFYKILGAENKNYPVYVLSAIYPWMFFSQAWNQATVSVTANHYLIKKVAFMREVLPLSIIGSSLIRLLVSLAVFTILIILFQPSVLKHWGITALPLAILGQTILLIGISLITSALETFYRDIKYLVEIALLILFYLTPIIYEISILSPLMSNIVLWNPLTGIMALYRLAFLGVLPISPAWLAVHSVEILLILAAGIMVFNKVKKAFADYL
ncbi:MAG: ABC transporter permease [Parcubacteria group bacterium]|nr:ABC transporter permease [Parcubacteria group bacterium]